MANEQRGGYLPYMPTYNSVAARGTLKGLTAPSALTPKDKDKLEDGPLGGFFDHMLEGNKKPTKQERINELLIARDVALGRVEKEEQRLKELRSKAPLLASTPWSIFNQRKKEGRIPAYDVWQGPDAPPFWADGDPSKLMHGTALQTELLYIDAELKRLSGKSGYNNRGESYVPERSYVPDDSIFYQDNLTSEKDADIGDFFGSILKGLGRK